jgi:glycerol-3-phosphate cytidylyltransferase
MVVYTVGTFDLLHVGHLALLEYCASLGDTVVVGVASDEVVQLYKPYPPVIPVDQRVQMLKSLACVDIVIPYYELDYLEICKQVKADVFVVGEDWGRKKHNLEIENYLNLHNKDIIKIKYSAENSSTQIKKDVIAQRLGANKALLGELREDKIGVAGVEKIISEQSCSNSISSAC